MFSGIEVMLGAVCSLMGIAVGYLLLVGIFTGIRFISKQPPIKQQNRTGPSVLQSAGKTLDT